MRGTRIRWVIVGGAAAAVLLTAGCGGGKAVTFSPAANSSGAVPAAGAPSAAGTSSSSSTAVSLPPNVQVVDSGSSVCVVDKNTGSQACVGKQGTAVVDGLVIVDGKVVSTTSSNGSVVVNGNATGGDVAPVATSGHVTLTGAVSWQGTATGTCRRNGDVRHAEVTLGSEGTLDVNAVGGGVVDIQLQAGGDSYSANWVGDDGVVALSPGSLSVRAASIGRDTHTVQVSATLNC